MRTRKVPLAKVREYMANARIPASQLNEFGYGETRPAAWNDAPEDCAPDRKVVIIARH